MRSNSLLRFPPSSQSLILHSTFYETLLLTNSALPPLFWNDKTVEKIFFLKSPKLIYIESLARTQRLSLSAKLVRPIVNRFFVQWESLKLILDGDDHHPPRQIQINDPVMMRRGRGWKLKADVECWGWLVWPHVWRSDLIENTSESMHLSISALDRESDGFCWSLLTVKTWQPWMMSQSFQRLTCSNF